MKINSSLTAPNAGTGAVSDRQAPTKPAGPGAQPVAGASVQLSELSSQLASSVAGSDFDHAKVEAIKQAIAEGKLTVNADAVADKLIANALALSNSQAR
ncbi:MAG TPA: flagellar biosynthesis anti-sigma factor FlgM [Casimicrobiaceae bacterium]|jgi:negative regulator of flagellin synthesis FlgM